MSAWVCDKEHFDVLVKAALHGASAQNTMSGVRGPISWWQVDEAGAFAGWRRLYTVERDDTDEMTPSAFGQMLVNENVRSVAYRYPDTNPDEGNMPGPVDAYYMGPYVYRDPGFTPTPGQVFKAIDCLDYQSCEHPGWRTSEAYAALASLRDAYCQQVDGYDDAPWGFDARNLNTARA